MQQTTDNERWNVLNNYKKFDEITLFYWYDKFTARLEYLKPLLTELQNKNMKLEDVCKQLAQEVDELNSLIIFLEHFKIYLQK
jgi:hypothetical protein